MQPCDEEDDADTQAQRQKFIRSVIVPKVIADDIRLMTTTEHAKLLDSFVARLLTELATVGLELRQKKCGLLYSYEAALQEAAPAASAPAGRGRS